MKPQHLQVRKVRASEPAPGKHVNEETIKQLTGGHEIRYPRLPPLSAEIKKQHDRANALRNAIMQSFAYISQARPAHYENAILKVEEILRAALDDDLERAEPTTGKETP